MQTHVRCKHRLSAQQWITSYHTKFNLVWGESESPCPQNLYNALTSIQCILPKNAGESMKYVQNCIKLLMENAKHKAKLHYITLSNPLAKYFYVYAVQCEQQCATSQKRCETAREDYIMTKKTEISCNVV